MHEFGHTFDSRDLGPFYLFVIGLPSLISASRAKQIDGEIDYVTTHKFFCAEMRANRYAKEYFGKYYGVDWNSPYNPWGYSWGTTIEDYYPTIK